MSSKRATRNAEHRERERKLRALVNTRADEEARRVARERGVDMYDDDGPSMAYYALHEREKRRAEVEIRGEHERARDLYIDAGLPVPGWVLA